MKAFRVLLWAALSLAAVSGCSRIAGEASESDLHQTSLATVWDEAMPLGNATLGALVWQREDRLRLSLDRIDLWDLRPVETHEGEHFSFEWIKDHIRNRDYGPVLEKYARPSDRYPGPSKIPGAALEIRTSDWGTVRDARLYLKEALCVVEWENGTSLRTFVQGDGRVGWLVFDRVPDSFDIELLPPPYGSGEKNVGGLGSASLALLGYPQGEVRRDGERIVYHQCGWDGFFYDVAVAWQRRGDRVVGAWSISSSLSGTDASQDVAQALSSGPGKAFKAHKAWWQAHWGLSSLEVPDSLIQVQYDREVYKFGSLARKDSYPISLQAVWTADDGMLPPWKGDYHHDLNTELSYWPAYSGNRLEEGLGYLNTLWDQRDTYKRYTRGFFGKEGMAIPGVCTLDGHNLGSNWVMYSMSPTTGAWLAQHFYLHWKYSADPVFLRERAYPFLKDVAMFLEQETELTSDGIRTLEFSASPEINDNRLEAWFPEITNYDLALIRFAFQASAEMADSLRLDTEAGHWRQLAAQLPAFALDEKGGLAIAPGYPYNVSHRHFSHAMAIHPLGLLDISQGPEAKQVIDATLSRLHANGPDWWCGYSYAWLANLEARAGHGEAAAEALRTFASCFCLRNSFHANGDQSRSGKSRFRYRPFTLEGNFAFAAGLQEMLLQSQSGVIEVFPAVPSDWKDIRFERLRAEGAFLVSAEMKDGVVTFLQVFSERGGCLRIRSPYDGQILVRELKAGERVTLDRGLDARSGRSAPERGVSG